MGRIGKVVLAVALAAGALAALGFVLANPRWLTGVDPEWGALRGGSEAVVAGDSAAFLEDGTRGIVFPALEPGTRVKVESDPRDFVEHRYPDPATKDRRVGIIVITGEHKGTVGEIKRYRLRPVAK